VLLLVQDPYPKVLPQGRVASLYTTLHSNQQDLGLVLLKATSISANAAGPRRPHEESQPEGKHILTVH
jgi:hypothetical protein